MEQPHGQPSSFLGRYRQRIAIASKMPQIEITDECAAAFFARDLMKGNPSSFTAGYSLKNAVTAACERIPSADKQEVTKQLKALLTRTW